MAALCRAALSSIATQAVTRVLAQAVVVGNAFHWFADVASLFEITRVLRVRPRRCRRR